MRVSDSNLIITQSEWYIHKKYDNSFNFYLTKPINHIIYNRNEICTIISKDIAILVQDIEYLKRYYFSINKDRQEQIKDRMALLIKFYQSANMLQYQYPMMVLTQTQHAFTQRRKKLSSIHEQEQASVSAKPSPHSNALRYQQGGQFLADLDWTDLFAPIQPARAGKKEIEFDEEFNIYGEDGPSKREINFFSKITKLADELTYEINLDYSSIQPQVSHLILDFDDVDRQKVIRQYKKLSNKENNPINTQTVTLQHLTDKKPLSSSITIDTLKESTFLQSKSKALNRQSMLIGSREQRQKQIKVMKKSSNALKGHKAFVFSQDIINQNQCQESPIHQPSKASFNFLPNPKPMKYSQIIHNDYFIKEKYQPHHHDFKLQLNKLKENPFQISPTHNNANFKKALPKHQEQHPNSNIARKQGVGGNRQKNQLPFYLKRVKSYEQAKRSPDFNKVRK